MTTDPGHPDPPDPRSAEANTFDAAAAGSGMIPVTGAPPGSPGRDRRRTPLTARGEPMVWLTGGALAVAVLMILALLAYVFVMGFTTFWPLPVEQVTLRDGTRVTGEPTRRSTLILIRDEAPDGGVIDADDADGLDDLLGDVPDTAPPDAGAFEGTPAVEDASLAGDATIEEGPGVRVEVLEVDEETGTRRVRYEIDRVLYKTGNFDVTNNDFTWVRRDQVADVERPEWAMVVERNAWGNAYGLLEAVTVDGVTYDDPRQAWDKFRDIHPRVRRLFDEIRRIERNDMGRIAQQQNELRIRLRGVERRDGPDGEEAARERERQQPVLDDLEARLTELRTKVADLRREMSGPTMTLRTGEGAVVPAQVSVPDAPMQVWQIVRAYPANRLSAGDSARVYGGRWWEYLTDDPREANLEGGVFPAIVGTVLLTMIMVVVVVPVGVIAAIYLREYARQGVIVSVVRVSVNNLAGVPSIVYGVFGLGFFCYFVGTSIDQIFYADRLPDPTVGRTAMIWASLTLALLTLPVVIVATEEALSAVPRSMREGSYACGASKWQTIHRIVLPRAMPGIMTGAILAIARGAGEVAPIMLVGAVKLAPQLPFNVWDAPLVGFEGWFGTNRSFMHLGFHIYDLGFQSRNSEAARNMVFTTTLLLISIVVLLNLSAIFIRSRLRRSMSGGNF